MKFIIIYSTFPSLKIGKKIANSLLKEKLIACVNFSPIESIYSWKGKIENSKEIAGIMKTKSENWQKVQAKIKELHPYEVPCIVKIRAEGSGEYARWIESI